MKFLSSFSHDVVARFIFEVGGGPGSGNDDPEPVDPGTESQISDFGQLVTGPDGKTTINIDISGQSQREFKRVHGENPVEAYMTADTVTDGAEREMEMIGDAIHKFERDELYELFLDGEVKGRKVGVEGLMKIQTELEAEISATDFLEAVKNAKLENISGNHTWVIEISYKKETEEKSAHYGIKPEDMTLYRLIKHGEKFFPYPPTPPAIQGVPEKRPGSVPPVPGTPPETAPSAEYPAPEPPPIPEEPIKLDPSEFPPIPPALF